MGAPMVRGATKRYNLPEPLSSLGEGQAILVLVSLPDWMSAFKITKLAICDSPTYKSKMSKGFVFMDTKVLVLHGAITQPEAC